MKWKPNFIICIKFGDVLSDLGTLILTIIKRNSPKNTLMVDAE